ncbi:radial spoke head 10 homolog B isoform X2 [Mugil cephalus]|uniref:radial spoke head 10 homolog B isoform X2 n=1 Tax=Mugil cephalus TaxID=48193 RepID=UPI001FB80775|nr:radial spoke head 10 homolog B isoform X2 [Mugil cephalus]
MLNMSEERKTKKLSTCSPSLSSSALAEPSNEQPEKDGFYVLPPFLVLIIQRYEGETNEGQFHGEGVACFEGGHVYKGMFSEGLMDGPGVFTLATGLKYEGEFVRNIPMGQGTYTWSDGSSYRGEVYNGIRHGTGTYKSAINGVTYSGQWHHDKRHGKGTVYYNVEKTSWYKGDWVMNKREGWGVRCYPSGDIYSGEWRNNLRHGEGTMKWPNLGQEYVGKWRDGAQHGQGTYVWTLRRADESQYSQSNQYKGDFSRGQRHGLGTFYYAGGAIYEGEWKNNKKEGQGKFTFTDGRVFEGKFVDDQMMTANSNEKRTPTPLGTFPLSETGLPVLGPHMALNIDCLLDKIPERKRDTERKQVEFVVLRQDMELKSIYSFYSRLGRAHSSDNTFLLSRMQFWRLLKDCNIHHRGITLTQIDHFIREDENSAEVHSPVTTFLFQQLLSYLVIVAYHIYSNVMVSQKDLLAACLTKLMTDDILPNAKNVKGLLFRQPEFAVKAMSYRKRCWEVYQAYCRDNAPRRDDQTMTCLHLLWMFKDLHLLDHKLTTLRLLEIANAENCDNNPSSCVDLEITFLEFFEVLLGCAEVKCQQVSEALGEDRPQSGSDPEARMDLPEAGAREEIMQTTDSSSPSTGTSTDQDVGSQHVKTEISETPQSAEHTEELRGEGTCVETSDTEARKDQDLDLEQRIQTVHQFFNHFLFPAYDHHQLVTRKMNEEKPPLVAGGQRHITVAKAQEMVKGTL